MSLFELKQQDSPLVISVPHDGALIPDDILSQMTPAVIGSSDRDLLISDVFEFNNLKYSKIKANYSRHVIDLNRPATGEALYQNQTETELCPTTTFDFKDIYQAGKQPNQAEIQHRIETYWQPYHQQLAELIATAKAQFGFCLLIDAHSIDDQVPRFFEGKLPDINVGTYAGKSCSAEIEQLLMEQLAEQKHFSYINNGRFKGGFITRNYGNPKENIHAIQLEHAKGCYLSAELALSKQAEKLTHFWQNTFSKLLQKLNEQLSQS